MIKKQENEYSDFTQTIRILIDYLFDNAIESEPRNIYQYDEILLMLTEPKLEAYSCCRKLGTCSLIFNNEENVEYQIYDFRFIIHGEKSIISLKFSVNNEPVSLFIDLPTTDYLPFHKIFSDDHFIGCFNQDSKEKSGSPEHILSNSELKKIIVRIESLL